MVMVAKTDTMETGRGESVHEARRQFRVLANTSLAQFRRTFITPFGRYCFRRLPFGITSAPEYFQKRMNGMLDGLPGVLYMMDDIILFGDFREEHDARAKAGLKRLEENRVTLNSGKCDFAKSNVSYIGHMCLSQGIEADLANVQAIMEMEQPTDVGDIRRFISKTNQLGKISPKLATITKPLRDLLSKQNQWTWGQSQAHAFEEVKRESIVTYLF